MSYNLSAEERLILHDPDNSGEEIPQEDAKNKSGNSNDNLTEDNSLTVDISEKRSTTVASKWAILPGGGMFYNKRPVWGILYALAECGVLARGFTTFDLEFTEGGDGYYNIFIGLGGYLGISIIEAMHANNLVKKHNKNLKAKYKIGLGPTPGKGVVASLHYMF